MKTCTRCNGPVLKPGEDGRGAHNRRLCRDCWIEVLQLAQQHKQLPRTQRKTLLDIASDFGVSVAAISQKLHYLIEEGQR